MKKHFLKKHEENWLRIPYEENADRSGICRRARDLQQIREL